METLPEENWQITGVLLLKFGKTLYLKCKAEEECALGHKIKERIKYWGDAKEQRNKEKMQEEKRKKQGLASPWRGEVRWVTSAAVGQQGHLHNREGHWTDSQLQPVSAGGSELPTASCSLCRGIMDYESRSFWNLRGCKLTGRNTFASRFSLLTDYSFNS